MREVVKARKPAARPIELTSYSSSPFADSWRPFLAEGVHLCSVAAPGYGIDAWAVEPASLDSLKSPDWRLRAQAVADIGAGKLKSPDKNDAAAVSSLAKDPHVLVRREVMRALAALKAAGQVVLLETALDDPESSVRIAAATALANVYGAESPKCLVAALARDAGFQMKLACVDALAAMKQSAQPALLEGVKSDAVAIREVSVRALGRNGLADSMGPLLSALASDPDYRVRYFAASGLAGYRAPAVIDALRQAMSDPTPAVQLAAVKTLGAVAAAIPADKSAAALSALERLFRQYGDGCRRSDAAWGWRVVGGAILAFGDPGKRSLEAMRTQKQDRWLAWAAYLVLHVPELAERVAPCDENHAATIHEKFAPTFPGHRR
jgi:HEAT repeat protein